MKLFSYICQTKLWEALKIDKLLEMPRLAAQTSETWDQHQRGVFTVSLQSCYCGILVPCSLKRAPRSHWKKNKLQHHVSSQKICKCVVVVVFQKTTFTQSMAPIVYPHNDSETVSKSGHLALNSHKLANFPSSSSLCLLDCICQDSSE